MDKTCTDDDFEDAVILCANARLARHLRAAHGARQLARGLKSWQPLMTATIAQWLEKWMDRALLAGDIPAGSGLPAPLNGAQERLLWERVISRDVAALGQEALFDRAGLAQTAQEADELVEAWGVELDAQDALAVETAAFLRWRAAFLAELAKSGWTNAVRWRAWQIQCIERGAGRLPARILFAGFDRLSPQERRLAKAFYTRGVRVADWPAGCEQSAAAHQLELPDARSECRAAAAWVARELANNPAARLAIVAPDLAALSGPLSDALDAALHSAAFDPAHFEAPRRYDFSLGQALIRHPLAGAALELLALLARSQDIEQARLSALLRGPYWGSQTDAAANARAQLDATIRAHLPPRTTLKEAHKLAVRHGYRGHTDDADGGLLTVPAAFRADALPSQWAQHFLDALRANGWPGTRALSSHEWQARRAFGETLAALGQFDALLGRVNCAEALQRLTELCRARIFQPESEIATVQVTGLLEASAEPLDGLWVMGMVDTRWPPPARPNPLLPAALQRRVDAPNAGTETQWAFARAIHQRLLRAAPQVIFSWAKTENGREQGMSPLLAGLPAAAAADYPLQESFAERLARGERGNAKRERINDTQAPALAEHETVRGGAGLLRAQAVCPAWAFYQYRLGGKALAQPVDGLDAMARGALLHSVLEHFWRAHPDSSPLADEGAAIDAAIRQALDAFNHQRNSPLSPRFAALEAERLQRVVARWLAFERSRPAAFTVAACEQEARLDINGLKIRLQVDRIDELESGEQIVIDYKTAAQVSAKSWNQERITEPQLPLYAAYVAAEAVGVAFAQVRPEKCAFVGIADKSGCLPGVLGINDEKARRLFPNISAWHDLLETWRARIDAIAGEVTRGEAAVRVEDETGLAWCEVLPLLRLAERRAQREEGLGGRGRA